MPTSSDLSHRTPPLGLAAGWLAAAAILLGTCEAAPTDRDAAASGAPKAAAASPSPKAGPPGAMRPGKVERVPFLGLITVQATPEQRSRAGLPPGFGLTVLFVVRNCPAQAAGIQGQDILSKFNEQFLVNEPQLRVLVRGSQPGEPVELTLVRGGKPLRVTVRPVVKEVAVMEGTSGNMGLWLIGPVGALSPKLTRTGFSARYEDPAHLLELKTDQQGKHLVAKDRGGAVLFQGPVNTPEERKAIPDAIRPKLEKLEAPPPAKVQAVPLPPPPASTPGLS